MVPWYCEWSIHTKQSWSDSHSRFSSSLRTMLPWSTWTWPNSGPTRSKPDDHGEQKESHLEQKGYSSRCDCSFPSLQREPSSNFEAGIGFDSFLIGLGLKHNAEEDDLRNAMAQVVRCALVSNKAMFATATTVKTKSRKNLQEISEQKLAMDSLQKQTQEALLDIADLNEAVSEMGPTSTTSRTVDGMISFLLALPEGESPPSAAPHGACNLAQRSGSLWYGAKEMCSDPVSTEINHCRTQ